MYDNDRETNIAAPWLSDPNTSIVIAPYREPENITSKTICGRVDGSEKIVNALSTCEGRQEYRCSHIRVNPLLVKVNPFGIPCREQKRQQGVNTGGLLYRSINRSREIV